MSDSNGHDSIGNAEKIIERFGGIRPMASKMSVPVTTVQGWKKRNVIPGNRRADVMQAAAVNNIDLSDLVAGAANENLSTGDKPFNLELSAALSASAPAGDRRHAEAVLSAEKRATASVSPPRRSPASSLPGNDAMMEEMRRAQSMTFIKSAWFTGVVVASVVVISAILLWPSKKQIDQNTRDIAAMHGEVGEVRERYSFLKNLIPGDIESRFGNIYEQTRVIQNAVTGLSARVDTIAQTALDPNVGVGAKIDMAVQQAAELGAPQQLTALLGRVRDMQQTIEGQTNLSAAIADLNLLVQNMQGRDGAAVDAALVAAQQEDDALGRALQGVAPQDLKAAALLLGLSQIRSSLHRSAPFEEDLALMQKMLGEDDPELQQAIAQLAPKAASGVLTPEGLKGEFKGLAGDIVVSSLKGEDVSIQEKARARFNDLLTVEKDGELLTGTDTQAKVARAQKMLDEGNIEGAIAELQTLDGPAATAAQPFIDEAAMTLLAERMQGLMTDRVIGRLSGAPGIDVYGAGIAPLLSEIKNLAPPRRVIGSDSDFRILEPAPKFAP